MGFVVPAEEGEMNGDMDGTAADWANAGVDNLTRRVAHLEQIVNGLIRQIEAMKKDSYGQPIDPRRYPQR